MTYPHSQLHSAASPQPRDADLDALLLDDEDDDFLDRHLAELRETLAEFRNY